MENDTGEEGLAYQQLFSIQIFMAFLKFKPS